MIDVLPCARPDSRATRGSGPAAAPFHLSPAPPETLT